MKTRARRVPARLVRGRRRWRTRALVAAAAAALAVPVAWAAHDFGDVPATNPHHDDVSSIRNAGITAGCNPPQNDLYCPDQPVRRDQMASFLRRGVGRAASAESESLLALTSDYQPILTTTLATGGAPGGTGYVVVTATASTLDSAAAFGAKVIQLRLHQVGGATSAAVATPVVPTPFAAVGSGTVTARFVVPTATTETFQLQARIAIGGTPVTASGRQLTAIYVPLGAGG